MWINCLPPSKLVMKKDQVMVSVISEQNKWKKRTPKLKPL